MNLIDILAPDCIRSPLAGTTKRDVIEELVAALVQAGKVPEPKVLADAVWAREQTRTTGIGNGLAIPHGKCAGMPAIAMAVGRPSAPMEFEAIDRKPVRLIVLLASPPDKPGDHIQALAKVSRLMMMDTFRERIYAATNPDEIYTLLTRSDS